MTITDLFLYANAMDGERFVPIKNFEGRFWISDFGRIVSHDHRKNTVKFLAPYIDVFGYYSVQLRMKPRQRKVRIHILVAEHFVTKSHPSHIWVNHKRGIKLWNYYNDLEWCTPAMNCAHAVKEGLHNIKGSRHPLGKLDESQVKAIRYLYTRGYTQKHIGQRFKISRRQIGDIVNALNHRGEKSNILGWVDIQNHWIASTRSSTIANVLKLLGNHNKDEKEETLL